MTPHHTNNQKSLVATEATIRDSFLDFNALKKAFFMLRSVSHPVRKRILHLLDRHSGLTVTEIYIRLRLEQSVASQHLSVLRAAGVVKAERDGKFIHYALNKDRIADISSYIGGLIETGL